MEWSQAGAGGLVETELRASLRAELTVSGRT